MGLFDFDLGFSSKKSSYNSTGTRTVNAPDWWTQGLPQINTNFGSFMNSYMPNGMAPGQSEALATLNGLNQDNTGRMVMYNGVNPALQGTAQRFDQIALQSPYQLSGNAPQVNAGNVSAATGYEMAQPYLDAYGTGVLDASLADYDVGTDRAANAFRARSIAGGSTGGAYGSNPVAAGVLAGEAARGRGSLAAQIRDNNLTRGFTFGIGDAGNKLAADTTTAHLAQNASLANAQIQQQRDMANLESLHRGDATKMQALQNMATLIQQQGDNAIKGDTAASQNAINALTAAGIPIDQAIAALQAQLGIFNVATAGFGATATESAKGKGSGFNFGLSGKGFE